jgi:hypothetical protein
MIRLSEEVNNFKLERSRKDSINETEYMRSAVKKISINQQQEKYILII